ncbi:MAG: LytR C-terminal domain-containing protein [Actinomycetia bacterium]|nr:LytR C-terminal domain-containing protein [Actinomycetes bacterium]
MDKEPQPVLATGYRSSRRSSKSGKKQRREATSERVKTEMAEKVGDAWRAVLTGVKYGVLAVAGGAALVGLLLALATGINAGARYLAKREAVQQNSPEAVAQRARDNVLVIATDGKTSTDFLAVRFDQKSGQIYGIAIPDGAFMEVPGQGFERIGDSYKAGADVSMAAISNYLSVPFEKHVVIDKQTYQDALTNQSLAGVFARVTETDLSADELARLSEFADSVDTDQVALVPLPVKPINLGDQTYYEPQREQVADLLLTWWGVKLASDEGIVRVIIYNGSGVPGIAGEAAKVLIKSGIRVVDTKNADRFDYKETMIVLQNDDTQAAETVKTVLGVGKIVEQPADQDVADIILIVGQDFKVPKE